MNYILLVVLFIGVIIVYIPMPRRKHYRKNKFKLKLKKGTIYSIFAFGFIVVGIILLLSFTKNGNSFLMINNLLGRYFGSVAILFPFVLIFFGFLFLKLRLFLSGINVSIGFLLFFISLDALLKQGMAGKEFFKILSDVLTDIGANVVYFAGVLVGLIVFFNTSVDQVVEFVQRIFKNLYRLFPSQLRGFFKNKKSSGFKENPMRIKGGSKIIPNLSTGPMVINSSTINKEPPLIADQLVSNSLTKAGLWEYPPLSLLADATSQKADRGDIKGIAKIIEETLDSFSIRAKVVEVNEGPAVTQYALQVGLGTKLSKITALANDLALRTEAPTGQIRIEAPIPGRNLVGIEIPNRSLEVVTLKTMLESNIMNKSKSKLIVSLGLDVSGNPVVANIAKMPHVLIAGTTGSGKSVLINSFISSLLFRASPAEVKLILIDPKRVELTGYNGIPHLMTPVIVEVEKILASLKWAMDEMDRRYKKFAEGGVRNIDSYNEFAGFQALPYIVILIDELADLMAFAPVDVEDAIARLAQMARATGIHLVVSTQRPSVDVITGLIKANIPCRIAFNVSSMIDSRVILDTPGAEKLLGRGDMLYVPPDQAKPTRIQGAFVSDKEVRKLVEFLKAKNPPVQYTEEVISSPLVLKKAGGPSIGGDGKDALFEEAIRCVCQYDRASASLLQRRLQVGYSRAARILDQLEAAGVVGPAEGSKPREVIGKNADEIINALHQG
ncbi:MAG: cell division FtsK/SpoIIIE [Candidatus Levybacteria bacterium GW2011_GWA1_37_16]|nr:MAG: cell division FtsK/SpoIIIE [Candidatus Levybacteria bacterium GW2011_GWA1_37_16]KKQ42207.1 MAG: cell division FtsK/SpoIIIE [Candidatus Levybacteria bacterium GW2011_GWB1_37_8]